MMSACEKSKFHVVPWLYPHRAFAVVARYHCTLDTLISLRRTGTASACGQRLNNRLRSLL